LVHQAKAVTVLYFAISAKKLYLCTRLRKKEEKQWLDI
jgi:hypothetical protein